MVGEEGDNFEGMDVVPLLDAIERCHCSVLWLRCHCWVPLLGAVVVCYGGGR